MTEEEAYAKEKKDQRERTPYKSKSRVTWMQNKVGGNEKNKKAEEEKREIVKV